MHLRSIALLLVFFVPILKVESAKLLLVICCDTLALDIQPALLSDLRNIQAEGRRISQYIGLPLEKVVLSGTDLNVKEFVDAISVLNVQSDDILLFYFSGHGYRTPSKGKDPWPNLFFTSAGRGIDLSQVIQLLAEKSPRLLISIADCCNNLMPDHIAPPLYPLESKKKHEAKAIRGYKKLFLETDGVILITSSKAEELAWCIPQGALYTLAFLESLKVEVKNRFPSWSVLLNRASVKVKKFQQPYYLLDVN